jgi:hypothetical protein
MNGIVEALLRLEGVKHKALIEANAQDYDESVRAQLHLLESAEDLAADAQTCPDTVLKLSLLIGQNTSLYQNLVSTSSLFVMNGMTYSPAGSAFVPAAPEQRIRVEG